MTEWSEEELRAIDDSHAARVEWGTGVTLCHRPTPVVAHILTIWWMKYDLLRTVFYQIYRGQMGMLLHVSIVKNKKKSRMDDSSM